MPAVTAEPVPMAGAMVMAAGRHAHLLRLAGLVIIAVTVIAAAVFIIALIIRRARARPDAGRPGAPGRAGPQPGVQAAAVAAVHLAKTYQMGKVEVRALDDVSLEISQGAMVCIMGRSGSGKSTLLRQLGLIDWPSSGRIWLHGQDVTRLTERQRSELRLRALGYVFQEYALLPELTAMENVCLPALMAGQPGRRARLRAAELLELVGLGPRARHRPRELSGGERQRVAIARALVNEPAVIFADEPTANLDTASARTVMQTLQKLNQALTVTVVFVSHDPSEAKYASQIIRLSDGKTSDAGDRTGKLSGAAP